MEEILYLLNKYRLRIDSPEIIKVAKGKYSKTSFLKRLKHKLKVDFSWPI